MKNNYNRIAPFYDHLVSLVYGKCQEKAQTTFLSKIEKGAKILVVGGGSGVFLPELLSLQPNITIDYLEPAPKMQSLAKKRLAKESSNQLTMIEKPLESFDLKESDYDAVLTFFFFDLFSFEKSTLLHKKLFESLKTDGLWLIADFNPPQNLQQKLIVKLMFLFLHFTVRADQKSIYPYETLFSSQKLKLENTKNLCNNLFFSSVYRKV